MADIRAAQAREAHRLARETVSLAGQHRAQRDQLMRQLREEDPQRWTYAALAAAVGCSAELVAAIIQCRTRVRR